MTIKISVVLTTYNRAEYLKKALISLACQSLPKESYEIIIIDDGSTDKTREVISLMEPIMSLRYSYQQNSGLASAKNHGLFLSSGEIVLFLDDDDVSDHNLIEQHVMAHNSNPEQNIAVLGKTRIASNLQADPLMRYVTQKDPMLFCYQGLNHQDELNYEYFWGGRTSCKRELLLKEGVFNPIFRFGYEDIELGYRLNQQVGLTVVYWEHAINTMIRKIDFQSFVIRCRRQGESAWRYYAMHKMDIDIERYLDRNKLLTDLEVLDAAYEASILSAAKLDTTIRTAVDMCYEVPINWQKVTELAYYRAFRAATCRGIKTAMKTSEQPWETKTF